MKQTASPKPPAKPVVSPWTTSTSLSYQHKKRQENGLEQTSIKLTLSFRCVKPLGSWIVRQLGRVGKAKRTLWFLGVAVTTNVLFFHIEGGVHFNLFGILSLIKELWTSGM
jgi:hypothetical protein